jgi:hypothetical protein
MRRGPVGGSDRMYRHTQIGYLTLVVLAGAAVLVASLPVPGLSFWFGLAVPLLVAMIFGSLTTEVTQDRFTFWFGLGLIRRSFVVSDIASCTPVVNPWFYGWGIHWTPHGWLYNVSGTQAVELTLRSGTTLRVGSDEPAQLCRMIQTMKGAA